MKTSYNILWLDDEPELVEQDRTDVRDFLEKYGVEAIITMIQAPEDGSVLENIQEQLDSPELDVLFVDYHMFGMDGAELVSIIRETNHVYLPVIFYSSSNVEVLLNAARENKLDGVYITNRDFISAKFEAVARSLLNKEHTIKRTRGLLMEGVSEIDSQFKIIYELGWSKLSPGDQGNLYKYAKGIVNKRSKDAAKVAKKFPDTLSFFALHMEEKFLTKTYDTHTRWRLVQRMLKYLNHDKTMRTLLKEFQNSLNTLRNDYAHKSREDLFTNHTVEKCIDIRRSLRSHQNNISNILSEMDQH